MGDGTPARAATAGEDAGAPDVMTEAQEEKWLAGWVRESLAGLRSDFGATHQVAYGLHDHTFWTWPLDGASVPLGRADPAALRALLEAAVHPTRWCKGCGEPVFIAGLSFMGGALHAATGSELGPDGHLAAATDEDPALRRQADQLEAEFPEFTVSVRMRFFAAERKDGRPGTVRPHYEDATFDGMRRQLAAITRRPS